LIHLASVKLMTCSGIVEGEGEGEGEDEGEGEG
jgi:hypothetical protein